MSMPMPKQVPLKTQKQQLERFQNEPEWQAKVEEAKKAYFALAMPDLARHFAQVRSRKKNLEEGVSLMNIELEALSQMLLENFEAAGISSFTLATGATCYRQDEAYSTVVEKDFVLDWIRRNKMQKMLSVHWQTLNALNKERLSQGQAPLPGTKVFLKSSTRLRNGSTNNDE